MVIITMVTTIMYHWVRYDYGSRPLELPCAATVFVRDGNGFALLKPAELCKRIGIDDV